MYVHIVTCTECYPPIVGEYQSADLADRWMLKHRTETGHMLLGMKTVRR